MLHRGIFIALALTTAISGCATSGAASINVASAASNRVYWDDVAGDSYRIKVSRDVGKMGSLCMSQIFVDGKLAAEIGQAEAAVFKVSPGSHTLKVTPALTSSTCKSFYSSPQMSRELSVSGASGDVKAFRYGFQSSGDPRLDPADQ